MISLLLAIDSWKDGNHATTESIHMKCQQFHAFAESFEQITPMAKK